MTKLEIFPEIETEVEDLIDHDHAGDLRLRIFNTLSGSSIIGVVVKEIEDSFLVALPSKLMAVQDKRAIEPYMPIRFCRMHKATILTTIPCFGEFEVFYIQYLLDVGKQQYPELFTKEFEERLVARFKKLKRIAEELKQELESLSGKVTEQKDLGSDIIGVPAGKYKH
jgi:hypothetical protein